MEKNAKMFMSIIGVIIVLGVAGFLISSSKTTAPGKYDQFAQCLTEKGMKFYGAFWCPHCQATKKIFGTATKFLNYIECSTLDGKDQTQVCKDAKIEGYPTFEFADGSRLSGEVSEIAASNKIGLSDLAGKTGCMLPDGTAATIPVTTPATSTTSPAK